MHFRHRSWKGSDLILEWFLKDCFERKIEDGELVQFSKEEENRKKEN